MIHPMAQAAITRRPTASFSLLAIGLTIVILASGKMAAAGIPIMSLGWWAWMRSDDHLWAAPTSVFMQQRRLAWLVVSAVFLAAGYIGGLSSPSLALPSFVALLAGASVWCLIPSHHGMMTGSHAGSIWTFLFMAGIKRWAALTLIAKAIEFGMAENGPLVGHSGRVIECLIVASGVTCIICIAQLWLTRKSRKAYETVITALQMQTAAVLAAMAGETWAIVETASRGASSALHVRQWMPFDESLPWMMIRWDALTLAALCFCVTQMISKQRMWASLVTGVLLLDLSAMPPLPGFWLKWSALQLCLYPHHIEPFAKMFDMHEGFRLLAVLAVVTQACVSVRLLSWLTEPWPNNSRTFAAAGDVIPLTQEHASGLASGHE